MNMIQREYELRFLTPAFLGNADQSGQWRTPPFKAQLRQWWRVAYAVSKNFRPDVAAMREDEGRLFGHAWLENDRDENGNKIAARKSCVRLRLIGSGNEQAPNWTLGTQSGVAPLNTGLDTSYAWFGLIKRSPLPDRTGIKASLAESTNNPESARQLLIAMPDNASPLIEEAMRLMNAFGTIGSRSRGGWGSLLVTERSAELKSIDWQRYSQGLNHCLSRDWAAALASDAQGPCVWESTSGYESWDKAMKVIATERKNLRSSLKLPSKDLRSALGFATPGRMPSPSRWKLFAREDGKLGIRTFAMPHRLPSDSKKQMTEADLERAWGLVIQTLDSSKTFSPRQKGART